MKKLVAALIIVLAIFLRTYDLNNNPPGVYVDEAAIGYNTYSFLETGKDEYGKTFPIFLKSIGAYSSAAYSYASILPVKLFGLTPFATRIVSSIAGISLVILVLKYLGPVPALVLAVSPIFVFLSRSASEANLALTIFMLGFFLSLKAKTNPRLLIPGFLAFALSAYAYRTEQLLSLVFIAYFSFIYLKSKKARPIVVLSTILTLTLLLPLFVVSLTPGGSSRSLGLLVDAPITHKIIVFVRHYLAYFSPNNLFSKPDPDLQRSFPELSVFYWFFLIPFIFGLKKLFKNRAFLILALVSPIPGALTLDYFSTIRALPLFLVFAWTISEGLKILIQKRTFLYVIITIFCVTELYSNMVLLKQERSTIWNYEYKALANFVKENPGSHLVIDNSRQKPVKTLLQFLNKMDPKKFHSTNVEDYYSDTSYNPNQSFDNLEIRPIYWKEDIY
ncbi:MAG: hypothetical protein Q7S79_03285, partial [bacterium]|nr:hypothetical protein [bacterium]